MVDMRCGLHKWNIFVFAALTPDIATIGSSLDQLEAVKPVLMPAPHGATFLHITLMKRFLNLMHYHSRSYLNPSELYQRRTKLIVDIKQ